MKYSSITGLFRKGFLEKRLKRFRAEFPEDRCRTIIDIGGTTTIWKLLGYRSEITLVNSDPGELNDRNGYRTIVGDGRDLHFPDRSFDLAFSNSVIEHVGDWADMQRFASELQRVGRSYYCQTPNKWFPIEPHLGTLFIHWRPSLLNHYFVVRYLTLWGLLNKPSRAQAARSVSEIRLLSRRELGRLFPESRIVTERLFLLPKSYSAVGSAHNF